MADVLAMSSSVPTAADDTNTASVPQTTKPSTTNKVATILAHPAPLHSSSTSAHIPLTACQPPLLRLPIDCLIVTVVPILELTCNLCIFLGLCCAFCALVLLQPAGVLLSEVLPKAGLVYSEKGNLSELLCKPKLMPLKSVSMQKIEQMEQRMQEKLRQQQQQQ